jgi:hypothetical protein
MDIMLPYLHTAKQAVERLSTIFLPLDNFKFVNRCIYQTYTMIGSQSDPGIMVRVMGDLFTHSVIQGKQQGVLYKVSVSFLEVYNENIRDLLSDVEEYLDLREDPIKVAVFYTNFSLRNPIIFIIFIGPCGSFHNRDRSNFWPGNYAIVATRKCPTIAGCYCGKRSLI